MDSGQADQAFDLVALFRERLDAIHDLLNIPGLRLNKEDTQLAPNIIDRGLVHQITTLTVEGNVHLRQAGFWIESGAGINHTISTQNDLAFNLSRTTFVIVGHGS